MKSLIIDRQHWACAGNNKGESMLLNPQGGMCCLGFWAEQICGISRKTLLNEGTPQEVRKSAEGIYSIEMNKLIDGIHNNDLTNAMMRINDSPSMTIFEKEQTLMYLFRHIDIDVKFVN